jgi:hypothetical protein
MALHVTHTTTTSASTHLHVVALTQGKIIVARTFIFVSFFGWLFAGVFVLFCFGPFFFWFDSGNMDTEFDLSFGNSDAPEGNDSGAVSKKEAKLQQKLAARERSKAKRKQQKIESKKLVTSASEEAVANHIKDPNPILVSNFDAEKEETVALVNELTSDKSRAGRIDEAIIPFSSMSSFNSAKHQVSR